MIEIKNKTNKVLKIITYRDKDVSERVSCYLKPGVTYSIEEIYLKSPNYVKIKTKKYFRSLSLEYE